MSFQSLFYKVIYGKDNSISRGLDQADERRSLPPDQLRELAHRTAARYSLGANPQEHSLSPRIRWAPLPFAFQGNIYGVPVQVNRGENIYLYGPVELPSDVDRYRLPVQTLEAVERLFAIPGVDTVHLKGFAFHVKKKDVVEWDEIHDDIIRAISETIFAGCENVNVARTEI